MSTVEKNPYPRGTAEAIEWSVRRQVKTNADQRTRAENVPTEAQTVMVQKAIQMLTAAGMVERYRTPAGASVYLGWPGRPGTLRVSDYQGKPDRHTFARLTFSKQMTLQSGDITHLVARALGMYLIKSGSAASNSLPDED
jgi:hypothetical protein